MSLVWNPRSSCAYCELCWKCCTWIVYTHIWGLLTTKSDRFNLLESEIPIGVAPTRYRRRRHKDKLKAFKNSCWSLGHDPSSPAGLTTIPRGRVREGWLESSRSWVLAKLFVSYLDLGLVHSKTGICECTKLYIHFLYLQNISCVY